MPGRPAALVGRNSRGFDNCFRTAHQTGGRLAKGESTSAPSSIDAAHEDIRRAQAKSFVGRNLCCFDNSGCLTQLADNLSQAGFVAVGVFLVDQVIPGSLIEKRGHLAVFFGRLLFVRLAAQLFDSGPELRAQGSVSEAPFV